MIILSLILLLVCLLFLVKSANFAIKYSSAISRSLKVPEFFISFLLVALISILPETTVSIISAIKGESEFAIGTLLGSNVADLLLVLGIVTIFSFKKINIKSEVLKNNLLYVSLLLLPLLLGFDGRFSKFDGIIFLFAGLFFFIKIFLDSKFLIKKGQHRVFVFKDFLFLLISLGVLVLSAFLTVKFGIDFAKGINIPVVIIGLSIISIGTCLPELTFSLKAIRKQHGELALGDIIGTVIIDSTLILGIVILINPFTFNPLIIYVLGMALFLASIFVVFFMTSNKSLSKLEGFALIFFYALFLLIEFFANGIIRF